MICPKCGAKMIKQKLKDTTYVGPYKIAYWCPCQVCIVKPICGDKCEDLHEYALDK